MNDSRLRDLAHVLSDSIEACFRLAYPTVEDMTELRRRTRQYSTLQKRLHERQNEVSEWLKVKARYDQAKSDLSALVQEYPSGREKEIQEQHRIAHDEQAQSDAQLRSLNGQIANTEIQLKKAVAQTQSLITEHQDALNAINENRVRVDQLRQAISERVNDLPEAWRVVAIHVTEEKVLSLRSEARHLANAGRQRDQLQIVTREYETRIERKKQVQYEIEQIPELAHQPIEDLEHEEQVARRQAQEAEAEHRNIDKQKQALEQRHDQRATLEKQRAEADRRAHLYKQLVKLLGRDHLQRYLLQQAETAIVTYTNEVLDRTSNGSLRLELQGSKASEPTVAMAQKAFELLAYHNETSTDPLPVWLLSGSQRFRVAVSLALGIGQYASQNGQRIESVIIDEGFGSLDKEGRRDMIDALRDLSGVVSRIILVSHQEEFADAFQNRYAIQLVDGTSQASLVDEL